MDKQAAKLKVEKLMAMGRSATANEHEADAALRQAAKLMTKYAIDQAELCDHTGNEPVFDMSTVLIPTNPKRPSRNTLTWLGIVGLGIGHLTDTRIGWERSPKWGMCLTISGELNDVMYASWLTKHLRDIVRASSSAFLGTRREVETFRRAMCSRLVDRMHELKADQARDLSGEPEP